ncbi:hypothetical protein CARUB_v10021874mg [Capsella rubella]|uniref:NmrA-like domain-containing protein n=2 Tax=Capsella rubella TaxID=81985 RepID=R0I8B7_9BRAS|nr:hypothetical protein CARUB_v10021874mg [Capsella rubella]
MDVGRSSKVEPAKSAFARKLETRRAVEAGGIPYTYIVTNYLSGYYLPTLVQFEPGLSSPPRDKVTIFGDGNTKAVFNKEEDIAAYTIKAVDDQRTLNKTLYINPPNNTLSMNEIVTLWEKKIGKSLEKTYLSEEQIFKSIQESPVPIKNLLAINHSVFVKGDQTNFTIEPSFGYEASELYPDVKYTTIDEYLSYFV